LKTVHEELTLSKHREPIAEIMNWNKCIIYLHILLDDNFLRSENRGG
jgi:hypothetical protein